MPWRNTRDPYKILVSEIMLHQTQVARVVPKYKEFLRAFPTLKTLAESENKKLLEVWKGLGYWRRAKYLKETAATIMRNHAGKFPKELQALETLPGLGPYTARALASFAWNSKEPFVDTNIRRVYLHFFFPGKNKVTDAEILEIARKAVWKKNPREWHYALFDYGALVLKDKSINKRSRTYAKQSPFKGSFRSFRTRVVRMLIQEPEGRASKEKVSNFLLEILRKEEAEYAPEEILQSLEKDGLLKKKGAFYSL
ncbi:MAG: A/G-specific adenine glycosylase [Nanoarchaeota archaeon]|nr:A/G-specific adenine glycosylase [Nanoarchaeota archaeon]